MADECAAALDYTKRRLASSTSEKLCETYAGKVVLVVNTASRCGYTPQYEGLEALYQRFRERGLVILGFPSNDFGAQEPGSEQEVEQFCRLNYGVNFPMFEKLRVSGADADPFYRQLAEQGGGAPRWNFHKYLIDRSGRVVQGFPSKVTPADLADQIEKLL